MLKIRYIIFTAFIFISVQSIGQIENDECRFATYIPDVEDFCSGQGGFTNEGSTASAQANPSCWPQNSATNDVWYSFKPKNLGVIISLTGENILGDGTLKSPSIALYSGTCNNLTELICESVLFDENRIELTQTELVIGRIYYIRIAARDEQIGSFKMCISTFSPVKQPESDCSKAVVLCSKDPFFVESLSGEGNDLNEVDRSLCLRAELNSVWYKWVVEKSGTLTFDILPNNKPDDIDFALFVLPGGLNDCNNKVLVRCMASGETIGSSADFNSPCFYSTGIGRDASDVSEEPGCSNGSDNYVSTVNMVEGETYLLLINNFSPSGFGFSIEFGGTGTFQGAKPNFDIAALEKFECDKTIAFSNLSVDGPDPIVSYTWSFGEGSTPQVSSEDGPIDVVYESFGDKTAALTVESARGCIITKTVDFFVEPCCSDTTQLDVRADAFDLRCFGIDEGRILVEGSFGSPEYEYSLGDGIYKPNPQFSNLAPGQYEIFIRDIKGCEEVTNVVIGTPPPIDVDAGENQSIDLGDQTSLFGTVSPSDQYTYQWIPIGGGADSSLSNYNVLDPDAFPCETTTYILQATNQFNCVSEDTVSVNVSTDYVIHSANILKAGSGDRFTLFGNDRAISHINQLLVFDRWGSKMYEGNNFAINDDRFGWDGMVNGNFVEQGVYTWLANVEFLCGVTPPAFKGDITIIR